jgi:Signal transduction histidine kinase
MKKKRLGIFGKVFLYTLSFLLMVIGLTVLLFARQIELVFEEGKKQVVMESIKPLVELLAGKSESEIRSVAEAFHRQNIGIRFYIRRSDGKILYETPVLRDLPEGFDIPQQDVPRLDHRMENGAAAQPASAYFAFRLSDEFSLHVFNQKLGQPDWNHPLVEKFAVALLVLLMISVLISYVFAHGMTKPILTLVRLTEIMTRLEHVPKPKVKNDEIGLLAKHVYQMYSALKSEIERVREIEENQRHFFTAASHELKTPVASAMVLLQGMMDNIGDYKDHPKYLRKCMEKMEAQCMIIEEMLEIVRLSDGNAELHAETVNIRSVVESILSSLQPLIDAKGLHITVSLPESLICRTDRRLIGISLSNVIMNAVQNTPENQRIKIWHEVGQKQGIRLCVLNTGAYIAEDELPKLFEPFYRVDKARSRSQGRSGLGLAIVDKSLRRMDAAFSLENTPEGVLFWMELPA